MSARAPQPPSRQAPASSAGSSVYKMTLRTLGRGDGLLGMFPFDKVGPRGGQITIVTMEPEAPYFALQLGLVRIPPDALQWRSDELAKQAKRQRHEWWTLTREEDFTDFCTEHLPALQERGWLIDIEPGFAHHPQHADGWHLDIRKLDLPEREGSWLVTMGVELEGEKYDLGPLLADLIKRDSRWLNAREIAAIEDRTLILLRVPGGKRIRTPAGPIKAIVSAMVELLTDPRRAEGPYKLSNWDAVRLDQLREHLVNSQDLRAGEHGRWQCQGPAGLHDLAKRLSPQAGSGQGVTDVPMPSGLGVTLRPYQRQGVAWLQYLREHHLAGILADDMGLGKTAQALAHILIEKQSGRLDCPALVVMPTSLLFNWQAEAARMTPELRVLCLQGSERAERFEQIGQFDIVLSTYPLIWRDLPALRNQAFHLLILDEAQTVKNPASKGAQAVRDIRARHRLCLTGTPMENHLGELWTQFDFLMPGFLGDMGSFQRRWRDPIEKNGETLRAQLLAQRVRPFILRRRKDDVAKELPPKTEIIKRIRLQGQQRNLYESVRVAADELVRRALTRQGFAGAQISILDALLKLRQVCCDPYLVKGRLMPAHMERAKLELLLDMLPELVSEGRRVLVFSQFTEMLSLIEAELLSLKLPHVMLTGATPPAQRGEVVARFQDKQVPIMLVSLKTGGVGLNLTAADTVIHVDPWWNPAVENQATDRAHRIGQDQQVFVYKLVVEGSIEDRILDLQDRKAALANGVLGQDTEASIKFGQAELDALLAPLDDELN